MSTKSLKYVLVMSYFEPGGSQYAPKKGKTNEKAFATLHALENWKLKHAPFLDDPSRLHPSVKGTFTYHIMRR